MSPPGPHPGRDPRRHQRVLGALVGSAVGDALGAPFEFGPPGGLSARFPRPARGERTEMCGGAGLAPGEWTDDTEMSLLVADSLLERGGVDEADLWARFVAWLRAGPRHVGVQTARVLASTSTWPAAAAADVAAGHHAAGNGSLMRTLPAAVFFARSPAEVTRKAARRISALTHGDPAAGAGCELYHGMLARALAGADPLDGLDDELAGLPDVLRAPWAEVLDPHWEPTHARVPNGAVWPTLGSAVWVLRRFSDVESGLRAVVDLGGDTDTLAAVAGGLLGAVYGIGAIPARWSSVVHGSVPGHPGLGGGREALEALAARLDGESGTLPAPSAWGPGIDPVEVAPHLWLADLSGAARGPADAVIISLCRAGEGLPQRERRQVWLSDDEDNLDARAVLADVVGMIEALRSEDRDVLVHCQGGASRTGFVLRGWLQATRGLDPPAATREALRLWPHTATWNPAFDAVLATWPGAGG